MFDTYVYKNFWKRLGAACFDAVGRIFFFFLPRSFRIDRQKIQKILVIRLDHIGDVLMTRPAIAALHEIFPAAQIDLLVSSDLAPLFEDAREIREIITMKDHSFSRHSNPALRGGERKQILQRLRKNRYDLAIDFRGDLRHNLLMFQAGIPIRAGYGITGGNFLLTHTAAYQRDQHQTQVQLNLLQSLGLKQSQIHNFPITYSGNKKWRFWNSAGRLLPANSRRIVIHAGAGYPGKQWPAASFVTLIQNILSQNLGHVILIGTEKEKTEFDLKNPAVLDLRGKTSLEELPILLDASDLFIGNDSGPAHIAAAQGTPMILLFSDINSPEVWKPLSNKQQLLVFKSSDPGDPAVTPEKVLDHVRTILSKNNPVALQ